MKKFISILIMIIMILPLGNSVFADTLDRPSLQAQIKDFIWPTQSKRVTSGYGWRADPDTGERKYHNGIDIGAVNQGVAGDSVWSAANGKVIAIKDTDDSERGLYVVVNTEWQGMFIQTVYQHLKTVDSSISVGGTIPLKKNLGTMGKTGKASGVHLHYEVREVGSINAAAFTGSTMDPEAFHRLIDSGANSIHPIISMNGQKASQIGYSDAGYGISKGEMFFTVDYILNTPIEKLRLIGLTAKDLSLLLNQSVPEIILYDNGKIKEILERLE